MTFFKLHIHLLPVFSKILPLNPFFAFSLVVFYNFCGHHLGIIGMIVFVPEFTFTKLGKRRENFSGYTQTGCTTPSYGRVSCVTEESLCTTDQY